MRILLLTASMDRGGAETHVFELARTLVERGCQVTVTSSGGRLAERLRENGVVHVALPLDRRSLLLLIRARRRLTRLLKNGNFDIVHAHSRIAAFLAQGVCRRAGVRFVTTVHAHFRPSRLLDRLSRWGSGVIAVSYDLYRYVQRTGKGIPVEQACIIPNGVDTERFLPAEKKGEGVTVVFLSRLDKDCSKAAFSLCGIAESLACRYGGIRIEIGGGGTEYQALKALAEQVNSRLGREIVRARGDIDDTAAFLRAADIFVGVSRAALEAMSCAVPVILAGDEGFLGVLDKHDLPLAESTNFCCRGSGALNDNALLDALCQLIDTPYDERRAIGNRLREYVKSTHSVGLMAERTERFYKAAGGVKGGQRGGVLICGYYGFGNMGDDLLLLSAVRRAKQKYGNIAVCALTDGATRDSDRFSVRCASRKNIFTVIKEIRNADTVVFGGGTLLQNATSRRSLLYYLFILRCAQRMGKVTELWGNGVGNIKGHFFRRATARALACCGYVGVRDKRSLVRVAELLREHGCAVPQVERERDLAVGYLAENAAVTDLLLRELGLGAGERFAVVIVRGNEKKDDLKALEAWAYRLRSSGVKLVFAAMYPKQDLKACRRMCQALSGVLAYPLSPTDLFGLVRRAYVVCSMRYHGLVLAADAGVPFVGFGNQDKIKSFCGDNGGVYAGMGLGESF